MFPVLVYVFTLATSSPHIAPHTHSSPPSTAVPSPIPVLLQCQQHLQHTQQLLQYNTHDLSLFSPNPAHHPLEVGAGASPAPHGHECDPPPAQYLPSHREPAGVSSGTVGLCLVCHSLLCLMWPFVKVALWHHMCSPLPFLSFPPPSPPICST